VMRLRVGRGRARAELVGGGAALWAAEVEFASVGELGVAVAALLVRDDLPARPGAVRFEIEPPLAQLRTLGGLPPVRPDQLRELVATQSGRFFRRNGHPLVTDAAWTLADRRTRGPAMAAAVEEPWVETLVDGARTAGVPVLAIEPAGLPADVSLDLVPPTERRRRRAHTLVGVRRLAFAVAMVWVAAGAVYLARLSHERAAVEREIAGLATPVAAVQRARRALGATAGIVETLERERAARGAVLGSLAGLIAALPDSDFATALTLDATGSGEVSLVARRSSEVIAALETSAAVVSPRIAGAVMRESVAGRDRERFTITFGGGSR